MEWLEKGGGVIAADMLYCRLAISQESMAGHVLELIALR